MIPFSHYSGAGNSFFFFDNRMENFRIEAIPGICKKNGIDGVILLEKSTIADHKMRIFNPDSSEAEMCGNGLRCFVKFLQEMNLIQKKYKIETMAGVHEAWISENEDVCVLMPKPGLIKWNVANNLHFLNTGVPHAVSFVDSVEKIDISVEGPRFRYHPFFSPQGTNVNFVTLKDNQTLLVRTYERGVEAETLACGTGAVASALAAAHCFSCASPIEVIVASGEKLKIFFSNDFTNIEMHGPALRIKQGFFALNDNFSIMCAS